MLSLQLVMALMAWIISRFKIPEDQAGESLATWIMGDWYRPFQSLPEQQPVDCSKEKTKKKKCGFNGGPMDYAFGWLQDYLR